MRLLRRRSGGTPREAALAAARKAAERVRRENAKAERYRAGKQADPVDRMTPNQWLGGGS